jgi:hypothetical protein
VIDVASSMSDHPGLNARQYRQCCEALTIPPDEALSPIALAEHVDPGVYLELLATPHAIERVRTWRVAGQPPIAADAIGRRFRFVGSESTRIMLAEYLLTGRVAPAAVSYLLSRVAVFAIGRTERGICSSAPPPSRDRLIHLYDRDVDAEEITAVFFHELGHALLFADPPAARDELEDTILASEGGWWGFAEHCGVAESVLARAVEDEHQAAALAKRWGAVGQAADGRFCASGPRRALERVRAAASPTSPSD